MIFTHTHILRFASICPSFFCRFTFSVRCFSSLHWERTREQDIDVESSAEGEKKIKKTTILFSFSFDSFCLFRLLIIFKHNVGASLSINSTLCRVYIRQKQSFEAVTLCVRYAQKHTHFFSSADRERVRRTSEWERWTRRKRDGKVETKYLYDI